MIRNRRNLNYDLLAFIMGLGSNLFVPTPVGRIAMLDIFAYVLAIPIFITAFPTYTKHVKRLFLFLVLWIINAIVSDLWRGTPFMIGFKAWMILVNSLALAIVGAWILRKSVRALPFFLVGCAISSVIQLYYFQNGALLYVAQVAGFSGKGGMSDFLIDKQVYPLWVGMFTAVMMALRVVGVVPWPICIGAYFAGGIFLMVQGGSRSGFLISVCVGALIIFYVYSRKLFNFFFKKKLVTLCGVVVAAILFNTLYMFAAKEGWLGEAGYKKLEEKKAGESSFMDNRADLLINWPFLWRSPIIGAGTEMIDRWGYVDNSPYAGHTDPMGRWYHHDSFYGHSCIVGAWTANGIFGLIFWAYVLWLIFDFLGEKLYCLKDAGPLVMTGLIGMCWAIAFSPYGWFRGKVMFVAAFVAMAQDPRFLAWLDGMPTGMWRRKGQAR